MSSTSPAPPDSLVRLTPLPASSLPAHPSLSENLPSSSQPQQAQRPQLLHFLLAVLDEGAAFLSPPTFKSTFTSTGSSKPSPPSRARVEVLKREISAAELQEQLKGPVAAPAGGESWFARRSRHANVSSKEQEGSASWAEFVFGLRDEHSRHECDFTPTLYDARKVLDWDGEVRQLFVGERNGGGGEGLVGRYSSVTMGVYEMCHIIPPPLKPRCFPVLVLTASTSSTSFLAVTIPVDLGNNLPAAFYSNGRNTTEGGSAQERKATVLGAYAAVETVQLLDGEKEIEWIMATTSDAKGVLPMWAQKLGIPGAIVKDVGFFLKWIKTVDHN